jgi:mono/diheme cytochrome c family protein
MVDALYSLLNAVGFKDPLHALIVHMPMGLVIGAFLLVLIAILFNKSKLMLTARHISILAFVFVFPTILFGVFDWLHFFKGAMIPAIRFKIILASAVLVILGTGIIVGSGVKVKTVPVAVISALAFVAVVGLGYFGGGLVYGGWATGARSAASATTAGSAGAASTAPANPAGEKLFADNCAACHANGGNVVVARLPLKNSPRLASLAELTAFIRSPKMPDGSEGSMPPFPASDLNDAQNKDLYDYIRGMLPSWR